MVDELCYRDHHVFRPSELAEAGSRARAADAWLLVTEKDAVRIPPSGPERYVLRIDMQFLGAAPKPEELGWR